MSANDSRASLILRLRLLAPVAALGLGAFVLVLQVSVAGVFRSTRPELALRLAPFDARARAELADRLAPSAASSAQDSALALALDAVRRDPLQPEALRIIAQSTGAPGAPPKSSEAALMFQAERMSRRDYLTQAWLIRYYLGRRDLSAVMRHFDIALRSSARARAMTFAMLAETARAPEFREELEKALLAKSVWSHEFAQYVVANNTDFAWAAKVALTVFDPASETDRPYFQTLLTRLADSGNYGLAWSVHQRLASPRTEASPASLPEGFEPTEGLPPFDWSFAQEPDLWAAPEEAENGSTILRVAARSGQAGEVARRLIRLPSGPYMVRVRMGDMPQDRQGRPELIVSCAGSTVSEPLVRLRNNTIGRNAALVEARLLVPSDCTFQWVTVQVSSLESMQDANPWLGDLQITPLPR